MVVVHSAGLIAIDVTPLSMVETAGGMVRHTGSRISSESMACTRPEPGLLEGVKSRSKVILRMNFTTRRTHAENTHRHIAWRFAGNDDRESLEFKTDELSIDEAAARSAKVVH